MLVTKAFKTFNVNKSFYGPKHIEEGSVESKLRCAIGATSNQVFTEV